jgi:ATP-dependent Zn protease
MTEEKFKMCMHKTENKNQRVIDIMKTKLLKKIDKLNQKIDLRIKSSNSLTLDNLLLPIILLITVGLLIYIMYQRQESLSPSLNTYTPHTPYNTPHTPYNTPHTPYNTPHTPYNTHTTQYY